MIKSLIKKKDAKKEVDEKKHIIEGNAIIAEFMQGFKNPQERWYSIFPDQHGYYSSHSLRYNESWDWLMPAINKMSHMDVPYEIRMSFGGMTRKVKESLSELDIALTWRLVVENVKWYNQNKK